MKKLILALLTLLSINVSAQTLEAKSVAALIAEIQNTKFTYKQTGMVFGFNTISSCLYLSKDIAIFKNYCFPAKEYPAKGFTIISKKYGMIDLYQEIVSDDLLKRDIQITEFPEILAPYLTTAIKDQTLPSLSSMMEKIHYRYNPGCWSTNFSWYTETADANCSVSDTKVDGFEAWSLETQTILYDVTNWNELMKAVEASIKR